MAFISIAAVSSSCNKEDGNGASILAGEWKLTEIGGVQASDLAKDEIGGLDLYLSFDAAGNFETFQRLGGSQRYVRYSGTYSVSGSTATGLYSDGTAWGADYGVSLEGDGTTLVMSANGEDCRYTKTSIPEEVRNTAVEPFVVKSSEEALPPHFL